VSYVGTGVIAGINCIFPFVVCMVLNVLNNMLFSNTPGAENYQFSPFYFTKCVQTGYPAKLWIIVLMSMLMEKYN